MATIRGFLLALIDESSEKVKISTNQGIFDVKVFAKFELLLTYENLLFQNIA